jgi:hypothetical protein
MLVVTSTFPIASRLTMRIVVPYGAGSTQRE